MLRLALLFLLSTPVLACEMKLLEANGNYDSSFFQLHIGQVMTDENETMNPQVALNAAQLVMNQVKCNLKLELKQSSCEKPFRMAPPICFVEGKKVSRYFIIMKDYVDSVNVIFNRWD
jgi:hypothetical protein